MTEVKIARPPERYMEERGAEVWNRLMKLAHMPEAHFRRDLTVARTLRIRAAHQTPPDIIGFHYVGRRSIARRSAGRYYCQPTQTNAGKIPEGTDLTSGICTASKQPGQALAVFLAIHHRMALTGSERVTLPKSLLAQLGVGRDAKSRALGALESGSLVTVERSSGRTARVALRIATSSTEKGN